MLKAQGLQRYFLYTHLEPYKEVWRERITKNKYL